MPIKKEAKSVIHEIYRSIRILVSLLNWAKINNTIPKPAHKKGKRQAPINTQLVFICASLLSQVSKMCLINKQNNKIPNKLAVIMHNTKEPRPLKETSDIKQFFTVKRSFSFQIVIGWGSGTIHLLFSLVLGVFHFLKWCHCLTPKC